MRLAHVRDLEPQRGAAAAPRAGPARVDRREPRLEQRDHVLVAVLVLVGALEELRGGRGGRERGRTRARSARRARSGCASCAVQLREPRAQLELAAVVGPVGELGLERARAVLGALRRARSGAASSCQTSLRRASSATDALEVLDLAGAIGEAVRRTGARGARAGARRRAAECAPERARASGRAARASAASRSSSRSQCCSASRTTSGTALSAASRVEDRERVLGAIEPLLEQQRALERELAALPDRRCGAPGPRGSRRARSRRRPSAARARGPRAPRASRARTRARSGTPRRRPRGGAARPSGSPRGADRARPPPRVRARRLAARRASRCSSSSWRCVAREQRVDLLGELRAAPSSDSARTSTAIALARSPRCSWSSRELEQRRDAAAPRTGAPRAARARRSDRSSRPERAQRVRAARERVGIARIELERARERALGLVGLRERLRAARRCACGWRSAPRARAAGRARRASRRAAARARADRRAARARAALRAPRARR